MRVGKDWNHQSHTQPDTRSPETIRSHVYEITDTNSKNALKGCGLLVNTTSLGMEGQPSLEQEIQNLNSDALVADIVYTPLKTAFLAKARQRGNPVVGGLGMLLHQAVRGFELWFGVKPEVTAELYELIAADVQKAQSNDFRWPHGLHRHRQKRSGQTIFCRRHSRV